MENKKLATGYGQSIGPADRKKSSYSKHKYQSAIPPRRKVGTGKGRKVISSRQENGIGKRLEDGKVANGILKHPSIEKKQKRNRIKDLCDKTIKTCKKANNLVVNILLLIGLIIYGIVGGLLFYHLEYTRRKEASQGMLDTAMLCSSKVLFNDWRQAKRMVDSCFPPCDPFNQQWTLAGGSVFAFASITTLGYSGLKPMSKSGRMFYICYCIIGMPLGLLFIANLGQLIETAAGEIVDKVKKCKKVMKDRRMEKEEREKEKKEMEKEKEKKEKKEKKKKKEPEKERKEKEKKEMEKERKEENIKEKIENEVEQEEEQEEEEEFEMGGLMLLILFLVYVALGVVATCLIIDLHFIDGVFTNFMAMMALDANDFLSVRGLHLPFSLAYLTGGLALATVAIRLLGTYLRKLHSIGKKIKNSGRAKIYFAGKAMHVSDLAKSLGNQLGVNVADVEKLDYDKIITETLEPPPPPPSPPPPTPPRPPRVPPSTPRPKKIPKAVNWMDNRTYQMRKEGNLAKVERRAKKIEEEPVEERDPVEVLLEEVINRVQGFPTNIGEELVSNKGQIKKWWKFKGRKK